MLNDLTFDPLAVWLAAALIATLMAHAALAKLADLPLFEQHLHAYGLPMSLLPVGTRALPAAELLAAVLLLTPLREVGAALAALLLSVYALTMAWHRLHRRALDCGCGGEPLPISWLLVARNGVLLGLALLAAATTGARVMGLADFSVVVASLALAVPLYAAFNQLLRHQRVPPSAPHNHSVGRTS